MLVKTPQTSEAAQKASKLIHEKNGYVVTLQNGLGNREILSQHVPLDRVVTGVTSAGSSILESGFVWHTGSGKSQIAATDPFNRMIACEIAQILNSSGIPSETVDVS